MFWLNLLLYCIDNYFDFAGHLLGTGFRNKSCGVLPLEDIVREFDIRSYGPITSAAGMPSGCLVVGRNDGSVGCFQLGTFEPGSPGIDYEFLFASSCLCRMLVEFICLNFTFLAMAEHILALIA